LAATPIYFSSSFFRCCCDACDLLKKVISISTIGVGFFARPIGAIILSHFGDRLGRKSMLILTLVSMGVATSLIGILPTYASTGIATPILLVACRLVQGIAVGGEWGGAVLMATEHSPPDKRGFYGSLVQIGFPLGMALGTASFFHWLTSAISSSCPGVGGYHSSRVQHSW
jgi:MFS transporter, MHS family, shikimate and dehydroshikimate transport protein